MRRTSNCVDSTVRRSKDLRFAFSLLETTIALSILGIGLIMVAAVFPVAITEHRESTEQARALELVSKAQAMIDAKINKAELWVDPSYLPGALPPPLGHLGEDSPWYLLPSPNLALGNDCWDAMLQGPSDELYANLANGFLPGVTATPPFSNRLSLFGLDILSDKLAPFTNFKNGSACTASGTGILVPSASPFTDSELMRTPNRLVWYGFYRRMAGGEFQFAAAICKQRRRQFFAEQDVSTDATPFTPYSSPAYLRTDRRLPVPWRVSVAADALFSNVLSNGAAPGGVFAATTGIATLAPIGSKIMISGVSQVACPMPPTPCAPPQVPSGRILTVSDVINDFTVEVTGDLSLIPRFDFTTGIGVSFDVWVFPPAFEAGFLGRQSPVIEWRVPI